MSNNHILPLLLLLTCFALAIDIASSDADVPKTFSSVHGLKESRKPPSKVFDVWIVVKADLMCGGERNLRAKIKITDGENPKSEYFG
jgi:hypothetical protein